MKYFTRRRYLAIQGESAKAERDWHAAGKGYASHLRSIQPRLSDSGRRLSGLTFHDGVIKSLRWASRKEVRIAVDASGNPWGPRGNFELRFHGVSALTAKGNLIGDWWLYEEIFLHRAGFAFHVLLVRSSLVVAASEFSLHALKPGKARR